MPALNYFKVFDFHEEDINATKNRINIWTFNEKSEVCLLRVEDYAIPCFIELPHIDEKWNSRRLNSLIKKLKYNTTDNGYSINMIQHFKKCSHAKRRQFFGYLKGERDHLEVRFGSSAAMRKCKTNLQNHKVSFNNKELELKLWEDDQEAVRKLTIERKLPYADWISAETEVVDEKDMISRLKPGHEFIASWKSLNPVLANLSKDWVVRPRIFSFDIESYSDNHLVFPNEFRPGCPAFMISVNFQILGLKETRKKYCIVMGDGKPPPDAIVYYVYDEGALLDKFVDLLSELDGDVLTGHNILGFDYKYLNQRLENLGKKWGVNGSRLKHVDPKFHNESWQSSNTNKVSVEYVDFPGRIYVDTLNVSKAIIRLPSYALQKVSEKFLGRGKVDITHIQLFEGFAAYTKALKLLESCTKNVDENGKFIKHENVDRTEYRKMIKEYAKSLITMGKLIEYCNEDSALVLDLFEKLNLWHNIVESSNTIQVRMRYVYTKGQGYKGMSQLYALLKTQNVVFNGSSIEVRKEKYEGALNLGKVYKKVGFFRNAMSGDIQSMYPSIMAANNLCPSTEIFAEDLKDYKPDQYKHHEWKDYEGTEQEFQYNIYFVTAEVHIGFIPQLVNNLKTFRSQVKDELKLVNEGTVDYIRLDAKQNAIKIVMNSIYGVLGTSKNPRIPAKHISALVTKLGRDTLRKIVEFIEHGGDPSKAPILPPGTILYGDTDSVQFTVEGLNYTDPLQWLALGERYMAELTKYITPLVLVFEKFGDFMFITPKKYIFHSRDMDKKQKDGTPNPNRGQYNGFKYTGVDVVKRNQCELIKRLYRQISELVMNEKYRPDLPEGEEKEDCRLYDIIDLVFTTIINTVNRKYPISDYVVYEAFNKESKSSPMGVFASNMTKQGKPIQLGERVPYVIVNYPGQKRDAKKGTKMRLIDSIGKNERLDIEYYIDKMITPIDALLRARYKNSPEFNNFMDRKRVISKMARILTKKNYIDGIVHDSPERTFMRMLKEKISKSANADNIKFPKKYKDLIEFRESQDYKDNVERGVKCSLSRAIKGINNLGLPLMMNLPDFVNNIIIADNINILQKYAKIMMSKAAYEKLYEN